MLTFLKLWGLGSGGGGFVYTNSCVAVIIRSFVPCSNVARVWGSCFRNGCICLQGAARCLRSAPAAVARLRVDIFNKTRAPANPAAAASATDAELIAESNI